MAISRSKKKEFIKRLVLEEAARREASEKIEAWEDRIDDAWAKSREGRISLAEEEKREKACGDGLAF